MATIEVQGRLLPLAADTTLGRHPRCTWRLDGHAVPSDWLQLRWFAQDERWRWRILASSTPQVPSRAWQAAKPGVLVASPVQIRLVDDRPPEDVLVRVGTDDVYVGDQAAFLVARSNPGWACRHDPEVPVIPGVPFAADGEAWIFHDGTGNVTRADIVPLADDPLAEFEFFWKPGKVGLRIHRHGDVVKELRPSVELSTLAPYLVARDSPRGMTRGEAALRWDAYRRACDLELVSEFRYGEYLARLVHTLNKELIGRVLEPVGAGKGPLRFAVPSSRVRETGSSPVKWPRVS